MMECVKVGGDADDVLVATDAIFVHIIPGGRVGAELCGPVEFSVVVVMAVDCIKAAYELGITFE